MLRQRHAPVKKEKVGDPRRTAGSASYLKCSEGVETADFERFLVKMQAKRNSFPAGSIKTRDEWSEPGKPTG